MKLIVLIVLIAGVWKAPTTPWRMELIVLIVYMSSLYIWNSLFIWNSLSSLSSLQAYGSKDGLLQLKVDKYSGDQVITAVHREHELLREFRCASFFTCTVTLCTFVSGSWFRQEGGGRAACLYHVTYGVYLVITHKSTSSERKRAKLVQTRGGGVQRVCTT